MKRVGLCLAAVLMVIGSARPSSATVITFDEADLVPGVGPDPYFSGAQKGSLLTDQLISFGLLFSIGSDGAAYISNDSFLGAAGSSLLSADYLVVNSLPMNNAGSPTTTLHVSFFDPVTGVATTASGVSAMVIDSNAIPNPRVTVNAFGTLGNLLESRSLMDYANTLMFTSSGIARLDFVDNGGDGHIIDNLTFALAPTSVPEPGTLALLASGLAFVGARRRWKN